MGNYQVRFLGGKGAVMPPTYPITKKIDMEKEKRTEEAIQVFRKMLVEEFGIKSTEQFFSTEGEDMAVIYESMKVEQENFNLTDEETNAVLDVIFDELDAQNADNKQQTD